MRSAEKTAEERLAEQYPEHRFEDVAAMDLGKTIVVSFERFAPVRFKHTCRFSFDDMARRSTLEFEAIALNAVVAAAETTREWGEWAYNAAVPPHDVVIEDALTSGRFRHPGEE